MSINTKTNNITMFVKDKWCPYWFPIQGHFVKRTMNGKEHLMFRDEHGREYSERNYSKTETDSNKKKRLAAEKEIQKLELEFRKWKYPEDAECPYQK